MVANCTFRCTTCARPCRAASDGECPAACTPCGANCGADPGHRLQAAQRSTPARTPTSARAAPARRSSGTRTATASGRRHHAQVLRHHAALGPHRQPAATAATPTATPSPARRRCSPLRGSCCGGFDFDCNAIERSAHRRRMRTQLQSGGARAPRLGCGAGSQLRRDQGSWLSCVEPARRRLLRPVTESCARRPAADLAARRRPPRPHRVQRERQHRHQRRQPITLHHRKPMSVSLKRR